MNPFNSPQPPQQPQGSGSEPPSSPFGTPPAGGSPFGSQPTSGSPFGGQPQSPFGGQPQSPFGASPQAAFGAGGPGHTGPLGPRRSGPNKLLIAVLVLVPLIAVGIALFVGARATNDAVEDAEATQQQVAEQVAEQLDGAEDALAEATEDLAGAADGLTDAAGSLVEDALDDVAGVTVPPVDATPGTAAAPTTEPVIPATVPPTIEPFVGDGAAQVVAAFTENLGVDQLRALEIVLYPEYAIATLQDPAIPENVDRYLWRTGQIGAPDPVRLVGDGDLETALYTADEVNWAAIPSLVAGAREAVAIPNGEVSHLIVHRPLPFSTDVQIRIFVTSDRDSGYVDASADGTIISVNGA
jgi:hypothetical protein